MILDVMAFRNKKLKCFANPYFSQEKIDNIEANLTRSIVYGGKAAQEKYKNLALYHFGTFDDMLGKYDLFAEPQLLFDCDDIIASIPEGD